jgi:hypothetical protein
MAVKAAALVAGGDFRQPMGGVQGEGFGDSAVHDSPAFMETGGTALIRIRKITL